MALVDPIFITTLPLFRFLDDQEKGIATGFFYKDENDNLYVVTNKHVIYGERYFENPEPEINGIKSKLHTNAQNLSQNEDITIDLFEGDDRKWIEHSNPDVDVVLIPVDVDRERFAVVPLDKTFIETSTIQIGLEKIFIMGYPFGWYDVTNNLPITRLGHLSSPFKIPFQGKPIMLGDVETHPGMSGGPVLMRLEDYTSIKNGKPVKHLGAYRIVLVGVHSGQPRWDLIDRRTGEVTETISHSLVHIWFSDLILEILSQAQSSQ